LIEQHPKPHTTQTPMPVMFDGCSNGVVILKKCVAWSR